jgi:glyoxylase-like metal-dependent hydrolase (beta-lactamase superfamily II)
VRVIDVEHMGRERVIGCCAIGGVIVDPGPESCVDTLLAKLDGEVPDAILLTHIHFDHAGAAGALAREWPDVPVYVHRRGAKHMADPSRLVASATRLYGEDGMKSLWGEVVPVPEARLHPLDGGEEVLGFAVEYTPGHASHHVCYLHRETGTALVGDMAGVRIVGSELTVAPTPPPDIDLDAWEASLQRIAAWEPSSLALTHFGIVEEVEAQLDAVRSALRSQAEDVAHCDLKSFVEQHTRRVRDALDPDTAAVYLQAAPPDHLWLGLDRWRSILAS